MVKPETTVVNGQEDCGEGEVQVIHMEPRPFRPFKSSEEYLYAMKEDLADWLNNLYEININADNFMESLETGVLLCRHANHIVRTARKWGRSGQNELSVTVPDQDVVYRSNVQPRTFHARDNVSNFITWCTKLAIMDCLRFETDDLVLRKNEKSVILCLLEVARLGAKFGMLAPLLVQMEDEIDTELSKVDFDSDGHDADNDSDATSSCGVEDPPPQIITNDLRSLHERVAELLNRCTCPCQFPMVRVSEGKYRIGNTKILIFVRILRNHVMVRVGGGWDTLGHYLEKHDPCQCRIAHKPSSSTKVTLNPGKGGLPSVKVTYNRPPSYSSGQIDGLLTSSHPHQHVRTTAVGQRDVGSSPNSYEIPPRGSSRSSHYSDDSTTSTTSPYFNSESPTPEMGQLADSSKPQFYLPGKRARTQPSIGTDSSSEFSEGESLTGSQIPSHTKKPSPRKVYYMSENLEESIRTANLSRLYSSNAYDSGFSPESPETTLVMSGDDLGETKGFRKYKIKESIQSARPVSSKIITGSLSSIANIPISKLRHTQKPTSADQVRKNTTISYKSQSTENLDSRKYSKKLHTYHENSFSFYSSSQKGRQPLTDSNCTFSSLPRSYSQSSNMRESGSLLTTNSPGQLSYKPPTDFLTKLGAGSKAQAFRHCDSKHSVGPDFHHLPFVGSTALSPYKTITNLKIRSTESSPLNTYPTKTVFVASKMHTLLKDIDLYTDHQFLEEMQKFIDSYKDKKLKEDLGEVEIQAPTDSISSTTAMTSSPNSEHRTNRRPNYTQPSPKIQLRQGSQGGSTKIPIPIWYNK